MANRRFWKGKRVFVSGHTGFKRGWLSIWLASLRARVTGYALEPNTIPSLYELTKLHTRIGSTIGDRRDLDRLIAAIRKGVPQLVFHWPSNRLFVDLTHSLSIRSQRT